MSEETKSYADTLFERLGNVSEKADDLTKRGIDHGYNETLTYNGATILIVGDMHLSSIFKGAHRDYKANCLHNMKMVLSHISDIRNAGNKVVLILAGDVFGVKERNLGDPGFRKIVYSWFKILNDQCEDVLAVRGNHDFGTAPEFSICESIGFIKNPKYVDFFDDAGKVHQLRLHFVNYGQARTIQFDFPETDYEINNIALGHNDFKVPGVDDFYGTSDNTIDVTTLSNFKGIDFLFFGDIHKPFDNLEEFSLTVQPDKVMYAYSIGSPARTSTSEVHEDSSIIKLEYNSEGACYDLNISEFGARPASEVFVENFDKSIPSETEFVEDEVTASRRERLANLIRNVSSTSLVVGDPIEQLRTYKAVNPKAATIAVEYYEKAQTMV